MKSLSELAAIRDKMKAQTNQRDVATDSDIRISVGMATCGIAAGARPVLNKFVEEISKRNLQHVKVVQTGCIGMCRYEPIVEIFVPNKEKVTYVLVDSEKVTRIVSEHIVNGNVINDFLVSK